jgi:hypothetical protein
MKLKRMATRLAAGSLLAGSLALAGTTGIALADTPLPAQQQNAAVSAQQPGAVPAAACFTRDGSARDGRRVGANPIRFDYPDSPYVGARYDSCQGVVRIHFGGYVSGVTHYNVRVNGGQVETRAGEALLITRQVGPGGPVSIDAQACTRGRIITPVPGFPPIRERSSCTRFSPLVTVQTR